MSYTYEKILVFRQNAENYKRRHPAKFSPFLYAIEKMLGATKTAATDFDEKSREINMKYAEKDKEGFFVYSKTTGPTGEVENFKFKEEQMKARDAEMKELLESTSSRDITPHIIPNLLTRLPKDLDFSWWSVLSPFVLPELTPELEEQLFNLPDKR